jgi:hypothetical protein
MRRVYRRIPLVALIIAPTLSGAASAQATRTVAAAVGCTYATCALRVERSLFGQRLVRGAMGERVSTIGAFGGGVDLLLGGADSAVVHAQAYVWNAKRSALLGGAGAITLGVVALRTRGSQSRHVTNGDVVAVAAGAAVLAISVPFELRARRELARAIWWYNGALPR